MIYLYPDNLLDKSLKSADFTSLRRKASSKLNKDKVSMLEEAGFVNIYESFTQEFSSRKRSELAIE